MSQPFNPFAQQAPQAPPAQPQQYAPQQPVQQYPQAQPAYNQFPQYPPVQQFQQFPQQLPQQPAAPLASGTVDDFYNQPKTGGGKPWSFKQPGETHTGVVRAKAYVQQDTQFGTNGQPAFWRDGRPKWVMIIPVTSPTGEEEKVYIRGDLESKLAAAMEQAGVPLNEKGHREVEVGAAIQIVFKGKIPAGNAMKNDYDVRYARPQGAAPAADEAQQQFQAPAPQPQVQQFPQAQQFQPTAVPQQPLPVPNGQPVQFAQAQAPQQFAQPQPTAAQPQMAPGLTPEQNAQLQGLLGGVQQ